MRGIGNGENLDKIVTFILGARDGYRESEAADTRKGRVVSGQLDAALGSEMTGDVRVPAWAHWDGSNVGTHTVRARPRSHLTQKRAQIYTYLLLAFLPTVLSVGFRHCPVNLRKEK